MRAVLARVPFPKSVSSACRLFARSLTPQRSKGSTLSFCMSPTQCNPTCMRPRGTTECTPRCKFLVSGTCPPHRHRPWRTTGATVGTEATLAGARGGQHGGALPSEVPPQHRPEGQPHHDVHLRRRHREDGEAGAGGGSSGRVVERQGTPANNKCTNPRVASKFPLFQTDWWSFF